MTDDPGLLDDATETTTHTEPVEQVIPLFPGAAEAVAWAMNDALTNDWALLCDVGCSRGCLLDDEGECVRCGRWLQQ